MNCKHYWWPSMSDSTHKDELTHVIAFCLKCDKVEYQNDGRRYEYGERNHAKDIPQVKEQEKL